MFRKLPKFFTTSRVSRCCIGIWIERRCGEIGPIWNEKRDVSSVGIHRRAGRREYLALPHGAKKRDLLIFCDAIFFTKNDYVTMTGSGLT
jgi:hypothetical protein